MRASLLNLCVSGSPLCAFSCLADIAGAEPNPVGRATAHNRLIRGKFRVYRIALCPRKIQGFRAIFTTPCATFPRDEFSRRKCVSMLSRLCYYRQRSTKIFSTPRGCRNNTTEAPMRDRSEQLPASTDPDPDLALFHLRGSARAFPYFQVRGRFRTQAFVKKDFACLSPLPLLSR